MKLNAVTGLVAALVLAGTAYAETAPADVVWVDDVQIPESLTGAPGNAEAGVAVVSSRAQGNCVACHEFTALPDVQFQGNIGPALDGVGSRWSEAELRGIIVDAKHMFPDTRMPSFYRVDGFIRPGDAFTGRAADPATFGPLLTAQQIEDTLAYLMTLTE
ncbi:sulfur oxidation c-type cytochrome SoxX [Pararhodobacter aggregans]|uniref:Sulfur oxidation c-type cytochrome SoxX n=1 Tax=Pararhodobacter aggregans TaxID=404875 RepID=A0A2T7UUA1_9RHOB|nr:sulfur oxidation c-type cytochrome SoxX [Pararhodobacter aggregans]PTX04206.1 monoheme cytochrome SoxX (sulfur oxidation) [Pararhodobacter aggregans]PVE48345.1 sulfur oxidation c-type cytochrome SoxX [Pararhodobacter aggregans]